MEESFSEYLLAYITNLSLFVMKPPAYFFGLPVMVNGRERSEMWTDMLGKWLAVSFKLFSLLLVASLVLSSAGPREPHPELALSC